MSARDFEAPPAILQTDPLKRLDAIIRRQGGKPKPDTPPSRMILPPVGKRSCEGQMTLDDAGPVDDEEQQP